MNLKSRRGLGTAEFDPREKYYKPAGFGGKPAAHYAYIEFGRHGWQYRPGGSAIVPSDRFLGYPRVCAHRGLSGSLPENTLAAFGAAAAMGTQEIELDLWPTADTDDNGIWAGEIVSYHNAHLPDGSPIREKTYGELAETKGLFGEAFPEERIPTLAEILEKLSCHVILALHLKTPDYTAPLPEEYLQAILRLLHRYDGLGHCYFLTGNQTVLRQLQTLAPEIPRCADVTDDPYGDTIATALETGCQRISLYRPYFAKLGMAAVRETIERAHQAGLRCNLYYADTAAEAEEYLSLGADVVLTNQLGQVLPVVKRHRRVLGLR